MLSLAGQGRSLVTQILILISFILDFRFAEYGKS